MNTLLCRISAWYAAGFWSLHSACLLDLIQRVNQERVS